MGVTHRRGSLQGLREDVRQIEMQTKRQATKAADEAARAIQKSIQDRLPPNAVKGKFRGDRATGAMKNAIRVGPARDYGRVIKVRVGPGPETDPRLLRVMDQHENGAVIKAPPGRPFRFQIDGRWISARQITILPKHWFEEGWEEGVEAAGEVIARVMAEVEP